MKTVPTLIALRGLPASGKSTRAKAWVAEDPVRRARVNRDDLRGMMHDGVFIKGGTERSILKARDALIRALLKWGVSVVSDDTNLSSRHIRELCRLAVLEKADFEVWDMTDVQPEECVRRDVRRMEEGFRFVGQPVIEDLWRRFVRGKTYPLPLPEESTEGSDVTPYVPRPGAPKAVLVDLDGTVALMCGRSPYDETRVHEDRPNKAVIAAVGSMYQEAFEVIFVSGRTEGCREATEEWLTSHVPFRYQALHMRKVGDIRKDAVVKREIFDQHIRDNWDVTCVFDDRNQVVEMWRSLGLTVFQVADGDF